MLNTSYLFVVVLNFTQFMQVTIYGDEVLLTVRDKVATHYFFRSLFNFPVR